MAYQLVLRVVALITLRFVPQDGWLLQGYFVLELFLMGRMRRMRRMGQFKCSLIL